MAAGYLYALINPSMPGLTKVGKTTRDPSDRVDELSSATGVATRFIVAYQEAVRDCDAAESWAHAELDRLGYRVATNREFFSAPLHEVVRVLAKASEVQGGWTEAPEGAVGKSLVGAAELRALGDAYRDGDGDVVQDLEKALSCYEQAGALGDWQAWLTAASIYELGRRPNAEAALRCHRNAEALGVYWASANMARLFASIGQPRSAERQWHRFWVMMQQEAVEDFQSAKQLALNAGPDYFYQLATGDLENPVPDDLLKLFVLEVEEYLAKMVASANKNASAQAPYWVKAHAIAARVRSNTL